jgi:hypothetical protein
VQGRPKRITKLPSKLQDFVLLKKGPSRAWWVRNLVLSLQGIIPEIVEVVSS